MMKIWIIDLNRIGIGIRVKRCDPDGSEPESSQRVTMLTATDPEGTEGARGVSHGFRF